MLMNPIAYSIASGHRCRIARFLTIQHPRRDATSRKFARADLPLCRQDVLHRNTQFVGTICFLVHRSMKNAEGESRDQPALGGYYGIQRLEIWPELAVQLFD